MEKREVLFYRTDIHVDETSGMRDELWAVKREGERARERRVRASEFRHFLLQRIVSHVAYSDTSLVVGSVNVHVSFFIISNAVN